jgi:hypothetical protein
LNTDYQPGALAPLIPNPSRPRKSKVGLWIGLGIGAILLCCVFAVIVIFFMRNQIPALASLFPSSTPRATSTSTVTMTPLASPTKTPLPPTPTPKSFVLTDTAFGADLKESCSTNVQITGVDGTSFTVSGDIQMSNSNWYVWCYDAKHTWIGTLTYAGYTFASDANDPLQFTLVQGLGYVYIAGKGSVTSPDGSVVTLP